MLTAFVMLSAVFQSTIAGKIFMSSQAQPGFGIDDAGIPHSIDYELLQVARGRNGCIGKTQGANLLAFSRG